MTETIAGIRIPDSTLCRDAQELARCVLPLEIFRHSLRSFVLARLIEERRGLACDRELLFVAAVLHDVGLAAEHRSTAERFEVDGANAATAFLEANGIDAQRRDTVWDAIALHSSGRIARWKRPEVALTNAGVVCDVHGLYLEGLEPSAIHDLLQRLPRTAFAEVFLRELATIAREKPESTANSFVADVGVRMVSGFHLENFVDELRAGDPFSAFGDGDHGGG